MTKIKKVSIKTEVEIYAEASDLPGRFAQLYEQARSQTAKAYAPYSRFFVGAALLFTDGSTIAGSNQENAAYPSGLCAERTALFYASSEFPGKIIEAIAVAARPETSDFVPVTPCGSCRQVLSEYENKQALPIKILLAGEGSEVLVLPSAEALLPLKFSSENLNP